MLFLLTANCPNILICQTPRQPSRLTRTTNINIFFISVPATQLGQAAASGKESRDEEMAFIRSAQYPRHVLSSPLESKSFKHFNLNKYHLNSPHPLQTKIILSLLAFARRIAAVLREDIISGLSEHSHRFPPHRISGRICDY